MNNFDFDVLLSKTRSVLFRKLSTWASFEREAQEMGDGVMAEKFKEAAKN